MNIGTYIESMRNIRARSAANKRAINEILGLRIRIKKWPMPDGWIVYTPKVVKMFPDWQSAMEFATKTVGKT